VLEPLDEHGEVDPGLMVIDRELYAWDIDSDGRGDPARVADRR
jgi:hypothetical protein